jgi:hypothetical protein
MDDKFDLQRFGCGIVAARRVIAAGHLRLAGGIVSVREEQLHMVVEAKAGEAVEIAAERDADEVRRERVDALHVQLAAARALMPDAAWRARVDVVRCGRSSN